MGPRRQSDGSRGARSTAGKCGARAGRRSAQEASPAVENSRHARRLTDSNQMGQPPREEIPMAPQIGIDRANPQRARRAEVPSRFHLSLAALLLLLVLGGRMAVAAHMPAY